MEEDASGAATARQMRTGLDVVTVPVKQPEERVIGVVACSHDIKTEDLIVGERTRPDLNPVGRIPIGDLYRRAKTRPTPTTEPPHVHPWPVMFVERDSIWCVCDLAFVVVSVPLVLYKVSLNVLCRRSCRLMARRITADSFVCVLISTMPPAVDNREALPTRVYMRERSTSANASPIDDPLPGLG